MSNRDTSTSCVHSIGVCYSFIRLTGANQSNHQASGTFLHHCQVQIDRSRSVRVRRNQRITHPSSRDCFDRFFLVDVRRQSSALEPMNTRRIESDLIGRNESLSKSFRQITAKRRSSPLGVSVLILSDVCIWWGLKFLSQLHRWASFPPRCCLIYYSEIFCQSKSGKTRRKISTQPLRFENEKDIFFSSHFWTTWVMSLVSTLVYLQQCFTRYGMTGYLTLGSVGLILNIAVFSQPAFRRNSCSLYILSMSIFGLLGLQISAVPVVYALDNPNPLNYNSFYCGIQFYLRHGFNQLMRTFFVLACADRYAACSRKPNIRAFSRCEVARRVIPCTSLFWLIVAIFPTMIRTLENGKCDARGGAFDTIYTIYILFTLGIFPLVSLSTFGVLMTRNLKEMRLRVQPTSITGEATAAPVLRKRDRDMMKMLLIELIIYIVTTIPNTIMHIYKSAADGIVKTKERQQIETFTIFLARVFLLYMCNTFSFWVYVVTSRSYRLEVKNLFIKAFHLVTGKWSFTD